LPGKPPFTVHDLRNLSDDDIDELSIAVADRLRTLRSVVCSCNEDSEALRKRIERVSYLFEKVHMIRRDRTTALHGDAARAAVTAERRLVIAARGKV
jgi:hypothetical protein